jgi:sulfur-oxidizing protein SoxY
MPATRRDLLKTALAVGAITQTGLLSARARAVASAEPFAARTPEAVISALYGDSVSQPSGDIEIDVPGLAEDGAVVPLKVNVRVRGVDSIAVIAGKNPIPLIASFTLGPGVIPFLTTRIKLAESSEVIVVARAEGKLYRASRFVRVVAGGCD